MRVGGRATARPSRTGLPLARVARSSARKGSDAARRGANRVFGSGVGSPDSTGVHRGVLQRRPLRRTAAPLSGGANVRTASLWGAPCGRGSRSRLDGSSRATVAHGGCGRGGTEAPVSGTHAEPRLRSRGRTQNRGSGLGDARRTEAPVSGTHGEAAGPRWRPSGTRRVDISSEISSGTCLSGHIPRGRALGARSTRTSDPSWEGVRWDNGRALRRRGDAHARGSARVIRASCRPRSVVFEGELERQGGHGPGDRVRLSMHDLLRGVRTCAAGKSETRPSRLRAPTPAALGNVANPMTGSRLQQVCRAVAEQPAEVVRNHGGGT